MLQRKTIDEKVNKMNKMKNIIMEEKRAKRFVEKFVRGRVL